jgi:aminoglycoside phosphotransferase (APT) family kinase protein
MNHSVAPLDLETVLSPEWLSSTLGASVAEVTVTERIDNLASKVRFRVAYEGAGRTDGLDAFCVKGYFLPESASWCNLGQLEVRFYRDLAPLVDVEVPTCVHAAIDAESGHGMIIMRDLVDADCTFLTAMSPYSVDQVSQTLRELAKLHHSDPTSCPSGTDWLAPRLNGYLGVMSQERLQELLDDGRATSLPAEIVDAGRIRSAFSALAGWATKNPDSVIHGDAHAGNLYLTPAGTPGLIDWQVLQLGPWVLDFAYHVAAVLDVADRERNERSLLVDYLSIRTSMGDDMPSLDDAWDMYRNALAYGFYMWSITHRVEVPIRNMFCTRLGSAVAYHETLNRLGA